MAAIIVRRRRMTFLWRMSACRRCSLTHAAMPHNLARASFRDKRLAGGKGSGDRAQMAAVLRFFEGSCLLRSTVESRATISDRAAAFHMFDYPSRAAAKLRHEH